MTFISDSEIYYSDKNIFSISQIVEIVRIYARRQVI